MDGVKKKTRALPTLAFANTDIAEMDGVKIRVPVLSRWMG